MERISDFSTLVASLIFGHLAETDVPMCDKLLPAWAGEGSLDAIMHVHSTGEGDHPRFGRRVLTCVECGGAGEGCDCEGVALVTAGQKVHYFSLEGSPNSVQCCSCGVYMDGATVPPNTHRCPVCGDPDW